MKNKTKLLYLFALMLLLVAAAALTACSEKLPPSALYTISFDTDGGTQIPSQTVEAGSTAAKPENPQKAGYAFEGWYQDPSFITRFDFSAAIHNHQTIYAHYINVYTITYFDAGGGAFSGVHGEKTPLSHTFGEETLLIEPTKTNYIFDGWFLNSSGTGTALPFLSATAFKQDIVLYARWTEMFSYVRYSMDIAAYEISVANGVTLFGDITLPDFYKGLPIRRIAERGFQHNIFENGFAKTNLLTSIIIPATVERIRPSAFENCTELTSVAFADESRLYDIAEEAFFNCKSLLSIIIPDSVQTIWRGAFRDCTSLSSIEIPNSVTQISSGAFRDCTSLTSITIPFVGYTLSGTSDTHFGWIFGASNSDNQNSVIPQSLKTVIVAGSSRIRDNAFRGCEGLTSIELPASVTNIGNDVFENCAGLTNITVDAENQNYASEDGVLFNKTKSILYTYPAKKAGSYIVPNLVTMIAQIAFINCTELTAVTIPNSVTSIGPAAFRDCTSLVSVTFQNGSQLTHIWNLAFYNCTSLSSIEIPNSVTQIYSGAFLDCTNLASVTFQNGSQLTRIEGDVFRNCTELTSITIPNSVTSIGDNAFHDCTSLASVTFQNGSQLTRIADNVFRNCTELTSITIPNSVTEMGYTLFSYCTNLTDVYVQGHTSPPAGWRSNWLGSNNNATVHWGQ
ncbi:MAG: leucine-rich repeat protein [Firmicutes bacterium]|nr:leucine-rich repeat protein [Bacillota bacterium]